MADDRMRAEGLGVLENNNVDNSVNPPVMVRGMMTRNPAGAWAYLGQDAANLRISAIGGTAGDRTLVDGTTQTISATLTPVSASPAGTVAGLVTNDQSYDAGKLLVSAKQGDAGLLRISAIGGTTGDRTIVDGSDQTISARIVQVSASISSNVNAFIVYAQNRGDASQFRASAFVDSGSISAKSSGADTFLVSAKQGDAGVLRVSAIVDNGSISAKSGDANQVHVSAVQGDAGLIRISAFVDNGSVSAKSGDANQVHVSAVQGDAGLTRISASLFPDTTGGLTVFQTLSVSASQSVKGSAGALYGYYFYNFDSKPTYIKLYNVSAAANIGTDTPLITVGIPASAAANMEYPHGLVGFTNGINITATSGRPLDNTALPGASSVGAMLFYK